MYKVFVNDNLLLLTNQVQKETDFELFLLDGIDLKQLLAKMFSNKIRKACIYHADEQHILRTFKDKLTVNKAGGGLVYNPQGQVLFIFRNGKWDLPKGGIEKGESIEDTALREVAEETGVANLSLGPKLLKTYHIFKRGGQYRLKITHWFEMHTDFSGEFTPQTEEGIEKVVWLSPSEWPEALRNSYKNISLLFDERLQEVRTDSGTSER